MKTTSLLALFGTTAAVLAHDGEDHGSEGHGDDYEVSSAIEVITDTYPAPDVTSEVYPIPIVTSESYPVPSDDHGDDHDGEASHSVPVPVKPTITTYPIPGNNTVAPPAATSSIVEAGAGSLVASLGAAAVAVLGAAMVL
ncbi:hypothetical protein B0T11DRAFT_343548 [Plectosphaerella cucumerina]|uniref:Uncharacterized protein n=1 Tax=Plectosphaerella cucumerina TaxID=40658 RepID=A0A8K0T9Y4_9PEZI|nr:hypothetical protein B0T11DRAFT_343548 [Plectosphaerella cucumerina]